MAEIGVFLKGTIHFNAKDVARQSRNQICGFVKETVWF